MSTSNDTGGLSAMLQGLGLRREGLERVRLGHGALGVSAGVTIAAFSVLLIAAFRAPPVLLAVIVGIVFLLPVIFLIVATRYAARHPGPALLGGAELVRSLRISAATKAIPVLPEAPLIDNPALQRSDDDA